MEARTGAIVKKFRNFVAWAEPVPKQQFFAFLGYLRLSCAQTIYMKQFYHKPMIPIKTRSSADADNRLDAFSGQSRSTNMVPFHMLHIVSYFAIVTLSLRRAVFYDIRLQINFMTLKWGSKVTQGHREWYHSIDCVWFPISVL